MLNECMFGKTAIKFMNYAVDFIYSWQFIFYGILGIEYYVCVHSLFALRFRIEHWEMSTLDLILVIACKFVMS